MDLVKYIDKIIARFFGTKHERDIKKMQPLVAAINAKEPEMTGAQRRAAERALCAR